MKSIVKKEFEFFESHKQEFVEKYLDKFIILVNHNIKGYYDTLDQAYSFASENFEEGTFLIQKCSKEKETQVFHSRAYL